MKFLHLFHKEVEFGNIEGYDDIKDTVGRALDAEDNYNLLFIGPPASAKTLFMLTSMTLEKMEYISRLQYQDTIRKGCKLESLF